MDVIKTFGFQSGRNTNKFKDGMANSSPYGCLVRDSMDGTVT